jgi:hypothetical protein
VRLAGQRERVKAFKARAKVKAQANRAPDALI